MQISCDSLGGFEEKAYICCKKKRLCIIFGSMKVIKRGRITANFYGGILVDSKNYENVLAMSKTFVEEFGITEEIKWQKVNEYWYEKYLTLVDFIFDLLAQGYIKIRIFFRNNQYTAPYLTREQRHKAYPLSLIHI